MNQFYSDVLSERVRYRMGEAVKSGRFVWRAPLGYRNVQANGTKNLAIDAERAPMIRKAFELLATGSYQRDAVLRAVNAMGLRTVRGAPVTPQSFSQMVCNPVYMGWIHSGENKVKGNFEAIVSEELFATVQDVLQGRGVPARAEFGFSLCTKSMNAPIRSLSSACFGEQRATSFARSDNTRQLGSSGDTSSPISGAD